MGNCLPCGAGEDRNRVSPLKLGPTKMTFAQAPAGGFASSYDKDPKKNYAFLIPGDEELFVGGGALNGAVGMLLFQHANQPIQFEKSRKGDIVKVKEGGKEVPKFSKDTCPYKKTMTPLFKRCLAKKNQTVLAEKDEIGSLPVVCSAGRTYSDCTHPFGSAFIHIFKSAYCPFGERKNAALLYCVGALGVNAKAPGEGAPDPSRAKFIKTGVRDFLWELNQTGTNTVRLLFDYNKHAKKESLPVIEVIRLPVVSGGIFLHPDVTPKEAALALIWGVHNALSENPSSLLDIELMPGKAMEEAYEEYKNRRKPSDWKERECKNGKKDVFQRISLNM